MRKLLLSVALTLTLTAQATELPAILSWVALEKSISTYLHWSPPKDPTLHRILGTEDGIYIAPTSEDIEQLLKFYRWRREGFPPIQEAWDCDNFAREFKHWADVWSVRYYARTPAALAVGMVYVRLDGDVSDIFPGLTNVHCLHVLNVILRNDGQWLFFEPQTGRLVSVESMIYEGTLEVLKVNL